MIKPTDRQHVGKNNSIIEINGKKYDAKKGELLSNSPRSVKPQKLESPMPTINNQPKVLDIKKPSKNNISRSPGKQIQHHPTKASKTLMREVVKKPKEPLKRRTRAIGPAEVQVQKNKATNIKPRITHKAVSSNNPLIQHFAPIEPTRIEPVLKIPSSELPISEGQTSNTNITNKNSTSDLLDNAIKKATSHQEKPYKKPNNRKKQSIAAMAIISMLLVGFVGYQELPNIKLELASAKAGFSASLPSYKPAGFSLGKINYSPGVIATSFNSNSDERVYTLTQKTTPWDSQALLDNFVKSNSKKYEKIQNGGNTIFIYGDGNATWVNGGIWYIVQSNGALTQAQLIELAKTL